MLLYLNDFISFYYYSFVLVFCALLLFLINRVLLFGVVGFSYGLLIDYYWVFCGFLLLGLLKFRLILLLLLLFIRLFLRSLLAELSLPFREIYVNLLSIAVNILIPLDSTISAKGSFLVYATRSSPK